MVVPTNSVDWSNTRAVPSGQTGESLKAQFCGQVRRAIHFHWKRQVADAADGWTEAVSLVSGEQICGLIRLARLR